MTAVLEMQDVTFAYPGGVRAVDGVSLALPPQVHLAVIGQNGAGKTTLVKMMNGLLRPDSGSVRLEGQDTRGWTAARVARRVGYVFQNPDDQIFNSSVRKEIAYGLGRLGVRGDRAEQRVAEAAALTGLEDVLEENPYDLPLSVRKFVTMASAVAVDCDVLVFDEPTAGQDQAGTDRIGAIAATLLERGKAVVTISHDMEFVARAADVVAVMAQGRVVASGAPGEVFTDLGAMRAADLLQPAVAELARRLGLPEVGLDVDRLATALRGR